MTSIFLTYGNRNENTMIIEGNHNTIYKKEKSKS